jgi:hypothetical protein
MRTDGWTERRDKANSRFRNFANATQKKKTCEHGNDKSDSIKGREHLEKLFNYQLLKCYFVSECPLFFPLLGQPNEMINTNTTSAPDAGK